MTREEWLARRLPRIKEVAKAAPPLTGEQVAALAPAWRAALGKASARQAAA